MSNVAVVFWSGTGNTHHMADAVVSGVKSAGGNAYIYDAHEFDSAHAVTYDAIAFGCPAKGAENLEEEVFQPMWDDVKSVLPGKKIALFGSYGWGDGEWMRNWEEEAKSLGANLACESVICLEEPNMDVIGKCKALGATLV